MEKLDILKYFRDKACFEDRRLMEKLEDLQKNINNGEGLTCVRDIINNIKNDNISGAQTICSWERSTINEYPEIKKLLKDRFFSSEEDHPWKEYEEMEKNDKKINEELAAALHCFIEKYIPSGWQENISKVDSAPRFLPEEVKKIKELITNDSAEEDLAEYLKTFRRGIYQKKWYIKQAIIDFFKQNKI